LIRRWREARFWLFAAVIIILLALGPELRFAGHVYPKVPTPPRLVADLFLVRVLREPDRFNVVLGLPMAVLAGLGVAHLIAGLHRWRVWIVPGLSALVLFDYVTVPFPTVDPPVPAWYEQLGREEGDFAILPIPMGNRVLRAPKRNMLYQTVHGKRTVTGKTARPPREAYAFIQANPLLRSVYETYAPDPEVCGVSQQLRELAGLGIRYAVVDKDHTPVVGIRRLRDWFPFQPHYDDDRLLVYRTDPQYGEDFGLTERVADGIGIVSLVPYREILAQGRSLELQVVWGTASAQATPWQVHVSFLDPSGAEALGADFAPCPGWPASEWGANAVVRTKAALPIPSSVEPGTYTVTVSLVDPRSGERAGAAAIGRQLELVPEREAVGAIEFGSFMRLLRYSVEHTDDEVALRLQWQALQERRKNYKIFVHLTDSTSGSKLAQVDVQPLNGRHSTAKWQVGEIVADRIALATGGLPPGTYRLEMGVYPVDGGARLALSEERGEGQPPDRFILPEVIEIP
jgi:hypothetical protein